MHMNGHKQIKKKIWAYAWKNGQKTSEIPEIVYTDMDNNVYERIEKNQYAKIGKVKERLGQHEVIFE